MQNNWFIVTSCIHSQFKECLWVGYNNTGHNKLTHMNITLLFWCAHNIVIMSIIVINTSMIYHGALFSVSSNPSASNDGPPVAKKSRGRSSSQKTSGCHFYKSSALNNFSDLSLVRWHVFVALTKQIYANYSMCYCTVCDCSIRIVWKDHENLIVTL